MEHALQSPTVQKALPDLASLHSTLGFDAFLSNPPPTVTSDAKAVREHLRGYAVQLERHERFTELWKQQYQNQLVNLRQLITALDTRCEELRQQVVRGSATEHDLDKRMLGLPEFEDLYYFLACKTRSLYGDLQLRFSSNFISLGDTLHYRGSSSYAQAPCSVRDIRNFLRAVWFHVLHPTMIRTIEEAINYRKYEALRANPLLPSWNGENMTAEERERMSHFQLGLNLDVSTIGSMFEHLDDVSVMSTPALLMKVSRKGLGIHYAPLEDRMSQHAADQHHAAREKAWRDLARESDDQTRQRVGHDEFENIPTYQRELFSSFQPRGGHAASGLGDAHESHAPTRKKSPVHSASVPFFPSATAPPLQNVKTWLPQFVAGEMRSPLTSVSGASPALKQDVPHTPALTHGSGHSIPSTPSNYRMPFHGLSEFHHEPPPPPPKSPNTLARIQKLEFEIGQRMQEDNARLQHALGQVEELRRENSQLQERLSMSSTPRGLLRRLSKNDRQSPRKSPRRSLVHGIRK